MFRFSLMTLVAASTAWAAPPPTTIPNAPPGFYFRNIKTDYGAVGDGVHDDTKAFAAAAASSDTDYGEQQSFTLPKVIYVPAGTYLVHDTIQWSQGYYDCCLSFRGAGQDSTVIRLADRSAGFADRTQPKPVLATRAGNQSFRQYITDLTVNTGSGNPGAIGISYIANNIGAMRNVTIVSGDGAGIAGLDLTAAWPGPSLQKTITVRGFDYGVRVGQAEYGPTFENVTVSGQNVAGFANFGNRVALRAYTSTNTVPALQNFSYPPNGALLVVKGATLKGGTASGSAVVSTNANGSDDQLYIQGATVAGYGTAITRDGTAIATMPAEYYSTAPTRLFPTDAASLQLPVQETPDPALDANTANWVHASDFTKLADLQAAIDKPNVSTLYLNTRERVVAYGTLRIPANLRSIVAFEAFLNTQPQYAHVYTDNVGSTLTLILAAGARPLIVQGLSASFLVQNQGRRTLVVRDCELGGFDGFTGGGKLFLDDVGMGRLNVRPGQSVWARQLNIELTGTKIQNNGGTLWILGFKTEQPGTQIATLAGGSTEILGTLMYPVLGLTPAQRKEPAFINAGSNVSVMYGTSVYAAGAFFPIQVRQKQAGVSKSLLTRTQTSATTLYVGRKQ